MTPWIAISLGLWLGQTPYTTEPATPQPPPTGSYDANQGTGGAGPPPDFSSRGVGGANVTDSDNPTFSTDQGVGSAQTGAYTEFGGPGTAAAGTGAGLDTRTTGTPSGTGEGASQAGTTALGTGTSTPGAPPSGAGAGTGGAGAAGTGTATGTETGGAGTGTSTETGTPSGGGPQGAVLQPPAQLLTPQQTANQIQQLQGQVQTLQQQLQQSQQQLQQTTQSAQNVQQDFSTLHSNSQQLEQLRQQRLQAINRAWQWLVAADNALELGQLDVAEPLGAANQALGDALQNASQLGKDETVALMQDSRDLLAEAQAQLNNRNTPYARWNLQAAGYSLYQARIAASGKPDVTLATPTPAGTAPAP